MQVHEHALGCSFRGMVLQVQDKVFLLPIRVMLWYSCLSSSSYVRMGRPLPLQIESSVRVRFKTLLMAARKSCLIDTAINTANEQPVENTRTRWNAYHTSADWRFQFGNRFSPWPSIPPRKLRPSCLDSILSTNYQLLLIDPPLPPLLRKPRLPHILWIVGHPLNSPHAKMGMM